MPSVQPRSPSIQPGVGRAPCRQLSMRLTALLLAVIVAATDCGQTGKVVRTLEEFVTKVRVSGKTIVTVKTIEEQILRVRITAAKAQTAAAIAEASDELKIARGVLKDATCEVTLKAALDDRLPSVAELIDAVTWKNLLGNRLTPYRAQAILDEFEKAFAPDREPYFALVVAWCELPETDS